MGQITNRGKKWELLNSWWIILSFFWFTAPWGFFYIGTKAKKKLWMTVGFIYLAVLGIFFFGWDKIYETIGGQAGGLLATLLGAGIYLSFKYREEYLIRLEMLNNENVKQNVKQTERERIADDLFQKGIPVQTPNTKQVENLAIEEHDVQRDDNIVKSPLMDNTPIDINSCSVESLTELPGLSLILAKKAVAYRQENNGFASIDEFYKIVELKPHFIAQIDGKIICNTIAGNTRIADNDQSGRKLDL